VCDMVIRRFPRWAHLWRRALIYSVSDTVDTGSGRVIALKGVAKDEVSEIRLIPASFESFVVNPEFGARVMA
jgi:hypothetical protein